MIAIAAIAVVVATVIAAIAGLLMATQLWSQYRAAARYWDEIPRGDILGRVRAEAHGSYACAAARLYRRCPLCGAGVNDAAPAVANRAPHCKCGQVVWLVAARHIPRGWRRGARTQDAIAAAVTEVRRGLARRGADPAS